MNKIGLISKREYSTRVKKKSFIIMTILGPLLIVGFLSLAIFISTQQEKKYNILVLDESDNVSDLQLLARKSWETRAKRLGLIENENPEN